MSPLCESISHVQHSLQQSSCTMCVLHALQPSHGVDLSAKMRQHMSLLSIPAISGTKAFALCAWSHNLWQLSLPLFSWTSVQLINNGAMTVRSNLQTACKLGWSGRRKFFRGSSQSCSALCIKALHVSGLVCLHVP